MIPKCYPGDLAVVIEAYNADNIGTIVKVVCLHPDQRELLVPPTDTLWTVEARHLMTYDYGGKKRGKRIGPVPDSYLQPIRGEPMGQDIALLVELNFIRERDNDTAVIERPVISFF